MNRRSIFRAALAGAVLGCTRFLPMPGAPKVESEPEARAGLVRLVATDAAVNRDPAVRAWLDECEVLLEAEVIRRADWFPGALNRIQRDLA